MRAYLSRYELPRPVLGLAHKVPVLGAGVGVLALHGWAGGSIVTIVMISDAGKTIFSLHLMNVFYIL